MRYEYTDSDANRLSVHSYKATQGQVASVYTNRDTVWVTAAEAPKAAQAILDAAGVKGVVIVGTNINVTLGAEADHNRVAEIVRGKTEAEARKKYEEIRKAHDDLRTSPIALKALALYNRECIGCGPYESWDATLDGDGVGEWTVRHFIGLAEEEEAKEKEAAEKLAARRDELAKELCDGTSIGPWYEAMGTVHKRAIDRIIELEDAKGVKAA